MPVASGTKLGPYEILASIGAGGMGEVYRAHDSRLKRDVAIKVSAAQFSERFEREAKAIAALNHPNICQIYDVGPDYLVMELIEGESPQGPLPLAEALRIARQIADALEAAHDKGITHRDLKPANIKIKPDGTVKVLDFGLAKVTAGPASSGENSPPLTMGVTQAGMILGTAAYMAPEQARGKENVDKRADIWAFGVVLYELLTGQRLFQGEDVGHTLAAVIMLEPDLSAAPAEVQPLLKRCLEKDPKKRLRDIGDMELLLLDSAPAAAPPTASAPRNWLWPAVAAVLALAVVGTAGYFATRPAPLALASRFTVDPPPGATFTNTYASSALSPDGHYLVFGAAEGSNAPMLWLRPLDSLTARLLPGTEGGNLPFWSPDSKSIAFISADGKLKRLDLAGGAAFVLCDVPPQSTAAAGGAWNRDGVILLGGTAGLWRVPANGGTPAPVTKADSAHQETGHGFPQFLPDGKHFLYFLQSGDPNIEGTYAASLDQPQNRTLVLRSSLKTIYTPPVSGGAGYLLSLRDGTLFAQPFDAGKLRLSGDPTPIAEDVPANGIQRAAYWSSDAGVLIHRSGHTANKYKLQWMSRDGKRLEQAAAEDYFGRFKLSPDGKKLAVTIRQANSSGGNVWILDLTRSVATRLTFAKALDEFPVWSPDGSQIAYTSLRIGTGAQIFRKDAAGAGQEEQLTSGPNPKDMTDWSHDGKYLIFSEPGPKTSIDIWALPITFGRGGGKPLALVQTPFIDDSGQLSPDGKWLAYRSYESNRPEVYIRAFPGDPSGADGKWQVSTGAGSQPRWRGDGKELFYADGGKLMSATVDANGSGVQIGALRELFSFPTAPGAIANFTYDVTADGQRFLVLDAAAGDQAPAAAPLTVVVNWQAALPK
jgi:Tol biopolymer transport system component/predicted Ser/Thr protein kinase